jgi:hypothetical protein
MCRRSTCLGQVPDLGEGGILIHEGPDGNLLEPRPQRIDAAEVEQQVSGLADLADTLGGGAEPARPVGVPVRPARVQPDAVEHAGREGPGHVGSVSTTSRTGS